MRLINPGSVLSFRPASKSAVNIHSVLIGHGAGNLTGEGFAVGDLWFSVGARPHTGRKVAAAYDHANRRFVVMAAHLDGEWPPIGPAFLASDA